MLMVVGMMGMAGTDAAAKWLVTIDYSVIQVLAVRGWVIVVLMLIIVAARNSWSQLKTKRPLGHAVRLFFNLAGPILLFLAYRDLPLADVTVILFSAIFWSAGLSHPLFGEKVGRHRWGAIIVGFLGVAVVMRPGTGFFQPAVVYALLAGACFAGLNLCARWLRRTENTMSLTFHAMVGLTVLTSLALPFYWTPMPLGDFLVFAAMGGFTLFGYYFMTQAFMVAPVGVVAPFEYSILLWATVLGYLLFGDIPDAWVWTGAAIVIASGVYLVHRAALAHEKGGTEPPHP
jgi:drug/metabolite transporter (DMT)-like permease